MALLCYLLLYIWQYMLENTETILVFAASLTAIMIVTSWKYNCSLPPGPWGIPYFGYLFFLKGSPHLKYWSFAKKYGEIFSIKLGSQILVVISDYRVIQKLFNKEEYSGRPRTEFTKILGGYGEYRV